MRGELKVAPLDAGAFEAGRDVYITAAELPEVLRRERIEAVRAHRKLLLVRLAGIGDASAAKSLRGWHMLVDREALAAVEPGSFRAADLLGFAVHDERLGALGVVADVRRYPSCDMLVVAPRETLIPMLSAYGFAVDREARIISVRLPEGFEEL